MPSQIDMVLNAWQLAASHPVGKVIDGVVEERISGNQTLDLA
jgi:hypothetical protein